jgi:cytochrome P450
MEMAQTALPQHIDPARVKHCELFDRKIVYENPYETIIPRIHHGPAVFFADNIMFQQPGWVVRRHADLRAIYADTEHFSTGGNSFFAQLLGEEWLSIPAELDPPRHTAFRSAVNPQFSPSRIMALDGRVRRRAGEIIDRFKGRGECEFISEFAVPFPVSIFLDLVGLPQARLEELVGWERGLIHGTTMEMRTDNLRAIKALLVETIERRKTNPGEDLISEALTLEVDGRKWNDDELFGYAFNLYLGGLDTVTANIGLHFRHLAALPVDQQTMRENTPEQNVVAIEELLRAYAAASTTRICVKPYVVGGETIMPGDVVIMATALPSRDPEAYEAPHEIRLDRRPTHVTLGHSYHRCLGQHLARRELQTAIEEFLRAIPAFEIKAGFQVPFFVGNVIHVPELQLTWS